MCRGNFIQVNALAAEHEPNISQTNRSWAILAPLTHNPFRRGVLADERAFRHTFNRFWTKAKIGLSCVGMTESIYTTRYRRLCELLVEARKSRGLSQAALAERLGWLQTVISKYERGERRLDLIEFLDVAQALEIDPHRIIRRLKVADV